MNVVIDTNLILTSISKKSQRNWLFQKLIDGDYILCVTTEILAEYAEIIERHMGSARAELFFEILMSLVNLKRVEIKYNWRLITVDPHDNKFVDCAIAGNAKFLVSHDKHFKVLNEIDFPKVEVIDIEQFKKELKIK